MGKISRELFEKTYELGKVFHAKKIDLKAAKQELKGFGMNPNSATNYLYAYGKFIEGERYTRTMNAAATRYYLGRIRRESGEHALRNALHALRQHLDYYSGKQSGVRIKGLVGILKEFEVQLDQQEFVEAYYETEFEGVEFTEGKVVKVLLNAHERSREARQKCIEHHGVNCKVCDFNFEQVFGSIGKGFIHVHHVVNLASIGREYTVDPIKDLVPVCPNCHAMLHTKNPAYTVEELRRVSQ
jgi:5-methylcytosine-specific restriction protein A